MAESVMHTWARTTFGLMVGKTVKTACGRRVLAQAVVDPDDVTCEQCRAVVVQVLNEARHMAEVASELLGVDVEIAGPRDTVEYGLALRLRDPEGR